MFCKKCGKENEEGSEFCVGCGESMSQVQNTQSQDIQQTPSVNKQINNQNINQQIVRRPWQGAVAGWVILVSVVVLCLVMVSLLPMALAVLNDPQTGGFIIIGFIFVIVIIVPLLILQIFISIGFFKGQKWAVIAAIILSGLALINSLLALVSGDLMSFIQLGFNGFILYLAITCLQHPFYNQK